MANDAGWVPPTRSDTDATCYVDFGLRFQAPGCRTVVVAYTGLGSEVNLSESSIHLIRFVDPVRLIRFV